MSRIPGTRLSAQLAAVLALSMLGCAGAGHAQAQAANALVSPITSVPKCSAANLGPGGHLILPTMTIKIINNSETQKLFPILSTGATSPESFWMQAAFCVPKAQLATRTFINKFVYRVYVNPTNGILPGKSVTLRVPLWSQIAPGGLAPPSGDQPDQYINWWQGGRVTLTTDAATIVTDIAADKQANMKSGFAGPVPNSPVIACDACEHLAVYQAAADLKGDQPTQLTEYTLAGVDRSTDPIGIDPKEVVYNISYVDSAALPVAMEPWDNIFVGWIGANTSTSVFQGAMNTFLATPVYAGWPSYLTETDPPAVVPNKIPSTHVVFSEFSGANPPVTLQPPGLVFQNMTDNWNDCVNAQNPAPGSVCAYIQEVDTLFKANYASYVAGWSAQWGCPGTPRSLNSVGGQNWYLFKIYGWVPFNEVPPVGACTSKIENEIAKTPGYSEAQVIQIQQHYISLQYKTAADGVVKGAAFNPYVQLIHGAGFLNLKNAYGFSVDDGVGVQQVPGTGIVLAVGGVAGLPNPAQFDPNAAVVVVAGDTPGSTNKFIQYGVCQDTGPDIEPVNSCPEMYPFESPGSFKIPSLPFGRTRVVLLDANGGKYRFVITSAPPTNWSTDPTHPNNTMLACVAGDPNKAWCGFLTGYTLAANTPSNSTGVRQNYINARGPNP